ncbi:hypothetical protein C1H46_029086, partial [Malus baccata]
CFSNLASFHFIFVLEPSLFSTSPLALPKAETKPTYAGIKSQVSDTHRGKTLKKKSPCPVILIFRRYADGSMSNVFVGFQWCISRLTRMNRSGYNNSKTNMRSNGKKNSGREAEAYGYKRKRYEPWFCTNIDLD